MVKKRLLIILLLVAVFLASFQICSAGIKVSNEDCPVFITGHIIGEQVVQYPNGSYSMMGLSPGFASNKFPFSVTFKTLTNFIATARYKPVLSAIVLTDGSGKTPMSRFEFEMKFDKPGAMYMQIVDWKITFPTEGFYAYNVFVDGVLVGYYPFYVSSR